MLLDFVPGFLQGVSRVIISYPFDYLKTYLQMNRGSTIEFLKQHSLKSVYRGALIPLTTVPIDRAIQYRLFEFCNTKMNPLFSGICCGTVSSVLFLPFSSLSNNYILNEQQNNLSSYLKQLYNKGGVSFFYRGLQPEIARSILSTTIFLGVYGNMRERFGNSKTQCVINSAVSGITLWTIVYPLDTIKIEQQINSNKTVTQIVKQRVNKYGVANLWRGIIPVYARTLPSASVGMIVYETSRYYVGEYKKIVN